MVSISQPPKKKRGGVRHKIMNDSLSVADAAGAMLLIQQRGGDKPISAETEKGAPVPKEKAAFLPAQQFARGQKKKKKTAASNNDRTGGRMSTTPFLYENYDWQTYEVFDLQKANALPKLVRSPAKVARPANVGVNNSVAAKRKIGVKAGVGVASQAKAKRRKGIKKSKKNTKAEAGVSAAAESARLVAVAKVTPPVTPASLRQINDKLRRELAEKTAQLEEAKRLRGVAVSANQPQFWQSPEGMQAHAGAWKSGRGHGAPKVSTKASRKAKNSAPAFFSSIETQNAQVFKANRKKPARRKAQRVKGAAFISVTRTTDGGKYKFAEAKAYRVDEPGDDKTVPPPRLKMAEWESQVNRGQWARLRQFTDCKRCFGHCGASHKKDDGCLAAQEIRRFKLKKHYMDIQRSKIKAMKQALKQANIMSSEEERREMIREMNMAKKKSHSQMSSAQRKRDLLNKKPIYPSCV